jgi:hypothetical protein
MKLAITYYIAELLEDVLKDFMVATGKIKHTNHLIIEFCRCHMSEKVSNEIINWHCVFSESDNDKLVKYFEKVSA